MGYAHPASILFEFVRSENVEVVKEGKEGKENEGRKGGAKIYKTYPNPIAGILVPSFRGNLRFLRSRASFAI